MKYIPTFVAALLILNGCSKKPDTPVEPAPANHKVQPPLLRITSTLPAGILIEVEGKTLTRDDLDKKISEKLARMIPPNTPSSVPMGSVPKMEKRLRQQMMEEFITRTVLLKRAEKENFAITPEDEQQAFNRIKANNNLHMSQEEFVQQNPLGGDGLQLLREEAQIGKLLAPYRTMPVEITQPEMDDFTKRTRHMLDTPERIRTRRVLVAVGPDDNEETRAAKKAKVEQAREELAGGRDFTQVAAAYSDGPEKAQGGNMGTFKRGARSKDYDAAFAQGLPQ